MKQKIEWSVFYIDENFTFLERSFPVFPFGSIEILETYFMHWVKLIQIVLAETQIYKSIDKWFPQTFIREKNELKPETEALLTFQVICPGLVSAKPRLWSYQQKGKLGW